jgi:hypothetical protein
MALRDFQAALGGSGLVRYACPSSWTKDDLYSRFHSGRLIDSCTFVNPSGLEFAGTPGTFHKYWTFSASDLTSGIPNPDGPAVASDTGESLFTRFTQSAAPVGRERYTEALIASSVEIKEQIEALRDRRSRKSTSERAEDERERRAIADEVRSFQGLQRQVVSAAIELDAAARDLGLRWAVVVVD